MPTLETERLVLRKFALTDWDALNTMLSDPFVTRYMHFASWSEEQRRTWLAQIVQEAQENVGMHFIVAFGGRATCLKLCERDVPMSLLFSVRAGSSLNAKRRILLLLGSCR